jgi:hypothetical protein
MKLNIYKNQKTAANAVKKQAISGIEHEFKNHCSTEGTGIVVQFTVDNVEDKNELNDRGFLAIIKK